MSITLERTAVPIKTGTFSSLVNIHLIPYFYSPIVSFRQTSVAKLSRNYCARDGKLAFVHYVPKLIPTLKCHNSGTNTTTIVAYVN